MHPRLRTTLIASATALVALVLGIFLGGHPQSLPGGLRDLLVQEDTATRAALIKDIESDFYKPVKGSSLEQASFKGIVSSLHDRFSEYFTPAETKVFTQNLNAKFEGIGVTIAGEKAGLRVGKVFDKSPAKEAGLLPGDLIVQVNGKSIVGQPSEVSTAKIRGTAGTSVNLGYRRVKGGPVKVVRVDRRQIDLPLVESKSVTSKGRKIAVIRLMEFSNGAHGEVRQAVDRALKGGAKGIVLDLRGNPGGILGEGQLVASIFVNKGLIVSTKGRTQSEQKLYATGGAIPANIPMVVLVDAGTASAAEIVTGALRDYNRATVVGHKTFGKGVYQQTVPLANAGLLKLTVGSYFLPKGENLAGNGIEAQVRAPADDPKTKRDEGLPVALRTLLGKLR